MSPALITAALVENHAAGTRRAYLRTFAIDDLDQRELGAGKVFPYARIL